MAINVALIVVAITIGVGIWWKANSLAENVAALERERSLEVSSTPSEYDILAGYSAVTDARVGRLNGQIAYARQQAEDWSLGFVAYVIGVIGLASLLFFVVPWIQNLPPPPRREDFSEFTELGKRARDGFAGAATLINKAIPRQPILGGLSAADELRKWEDLRKEGLVTDEEYKKMRDKLVG